MLDTLSESILHIQVYPFYFWFMETLSVITSGTNELSLYTIKIQLAQSEKNMLKFVA